MTNQTKRFVGSGVVGDSANTANLRALIGEMKWNNVDSLAKVSSPEDLGKSASTANIGALGGVRKTPSQAPDRTGTSGRESSAKEQPKK